MPTRRLHSRRRLFHTGHVVTEAMQPDQVAAGPAADQKHASRGSQPLRVDAVLKRVQSLVDFVRRRAEIAELNPQGRLKIPIAQNARSQVSEGARGETKQFASA